MLNKIKDIFIHLYNIIRYGEWSCGNDYVNPEEELLNFGFRSAYCDGYIILFYFFNYWIEVDY